MTIIQLEYLLAVANCGSFSLAAEHCFVTQPSLSMQVKALEEELGVVLLDRSKKPVIPTEAGDVVLERARETLRAYNNIRESVAELKGETSGKLRLGVIPTIAPYLLHKFIPAFVRDYPKVELEISEMITSDIVEALKRDRIDAALVASGTGQERRHGGSGDTAGAATRHKRGRRPMQAEDDNATQGGTDKTASEKQNAPGRKNRRTRPFRKSTSVPDLRGIGHNRIG